MTEEKAKAIAAEYCTNGRKKGAALRAVGYSVNYSEHAGLKLFDNVRIIEAIEVFGAKLIEKVENKATDILKELQIIAYSQAKPGLITTSDKIRALDLLGKNADGGLWTDRVNDGRLDEEALTKREQALADEVAQAHFRGPQLAQDGLKADKGEDIKGRTA